MDYFLIGMTGEYDVWDKYFSFDESFLFKNKEIEFVDAYGDIEIMQKLKIQALDQKGRVVKNQSFFTKDVAPCIIENESVFLFKESIFKENIFKDIKGIKFFTIKIKGDYKDKYKLMSFTNVIDCVDFSKSIKKDFDFLSKLILIKSKIPKNIDGFFLSKWDKFGEFNVVVNEILKNKLLELETASEFLIFDKIIFSENIDNNV